MKQRKSTLTWEAMKVEALYWQRHFRSCCRLGKRCCLGRKLVVESFFFPPTLCVPLCLSRNSKLPADSFGVVFFPPALCGFGDFLEASFLIASWSCFFLLSPALCGLPESCRGPLCSMARINERIGRLTGKKDNVDGL
jgi:hypothetical protein